MTRRSRGGSSRRAAASRTGSASAARWSGRSWVPWASTWAWAGEMAPSARAWPVWVNGPRNRARAVRTKPAAVLGLMRRRWRSQAAVEPTWTPWSAPAAPRASRTASSPSQWPSRRSASCRNTRTRSARVASLSRSGSWAARPWSSAASALSRSRRLVECVFESMAATYQPRTPRQAPLPHLGTTSPTEPGRRRVPAGSRPTPAPGNCMGPEDPNPPCQLPAPDPTPQAPDPPPPNRPRPDRPRPTRRRPSKSPQPGYPTRS